MTFTSGQKLTAKDLNELVKLSEGQNIPTDKSFIRSNGVNYYNPLNMSHRYNEKREIFDVQIRFVNVESDPNKPEINVPYWYIFLGTDYANIPQLNIDVWDIQLDCGSGIQMMQPMAVFTQPMPLEDNIDSYEWKDAVVEFTQDTTQQRIYNPSKTLNKQSQVVNSDNDGWFCTGLPVISKLSTLESLNTFHLYATFVRCTNITNIQTIPNFYYTVLILSNNPIMSVTQLFRDGKNEYTLPFGNKKLSFSEVLGGHSQEIASVTASKGRSGYTITRTGNYPSDAIKKSSENWEIVNKIFSADDIGDDDSNQMHKYKFVNTYFRTTEGIILTLDDLEDTNDYITFSKLPISQHQIADYYYVTLEEDIDEKPELKIRLVDDIGPDMSLSNYRDLSEFYTDLAYTKVQQEIIQNPTKKISLICVFLVNKNNSLPQNWSIEYVHYVERFPDFYAVLNDANSFIQENNRSLETIKIENGDKDLPVNQIYKFDDINYRESDLKYIEADVLLRKLSTDEAGESVVELGYASLDDIGIKTEGVTGDFDVVVRSEYSTVDHKLINKRKTFKYVDGLLTEVVDAADEEVFEAVEHINHEY